MATSLGFADTAQRLLEAGAEIADQPWDMCSAEYHDQEEVRTGSGVDFGPCERARGDELHFRRRGATLLMGNCQDGVH
jgi:hypothetical protein